MVEVATRAKTVTPEAVRATKGATENAAMLMVTRVAAKMVEENQAVMVSQNQRPRSA